MSRKGMGLGSTDSVVGTSRMSFGQSRKKKWQNTGRIIEVSIIEAKEDKVLRSDQLL